MSTLENLGQQLREKRGERGIREVAKEIGISHSTLSRVERGHLPDLENYQRICNWLGIEIAPLQAMVNPGDVKQLSVHFKKEQTLHSETAQALAEMILKAQDLLVAEGW